MSRATSHAVRAGHRVVLLSLEGWDSTWRRNQHLAVQVARHPDIREVLFIEPPEPGFALRARRHSPCQGIQVVRPPLLVPRRFGGHRLLAHWLRRTTRGVDIVWVNDPVAGHALVESGAPMIYDITDDWRSLTTSVADRERLIAAEDVLATRARTTVCSTVLAERWNDRYGVQAAIIHNAVDTDALVRATKHVLPGTGPHIVYVGTLHENRIDRDLIITLARAAIGDVHLVGPNFLSASSTAALKEAGVHLHGPVPSEKVPGWMISSDVLICPHVVDEFTLSLDAIKAYEYLATTVPIVATPSCGFQLLEANGLYVTTSEKFVDNVRQAIVLGPSTRLPVPSWADRAEEFCRILLSS